MKKNIKYNFKKNIRCEYNLKKKKKLIMWLAARNLNNC